MKYFHSVTLEEEKCKGCTICIKGCPTEAIRVKNGKAHIIAERCIDCGECIRTCPSGAKKAVSDPISLLDNYDYNIAIPAPTLYGQFPHTLSCNRILTALKRVGFDDVYEVAAAAEIITRQTKDFLEEHRGEGPFISSSCPVVVRLIETRFPSLLDQVIPIISPMELSARIVRELEKEREGRIGVFFISPCAAKVTDVRTPRGFEDSSVSGVIGIKDLFKDLSQAVGDVEIEEPLNTASSVGISWARTDGEGTAVHDENHIAVDGIRHVIEVLESLENGHIRNVDFVEMMSCPGGCVGGPLVVENPYVARNIVCTRERRHIPEKKAECQVLPPAVNIFWTRELESRTADLLDPDYRKAMKMMEELEQIQEGLPGLDCGACGAPSCRALAEDIVRGKAAETDCMIKLKEKIRNLTREMVGLEGCLPVIHKVSEDK